MDCSKDELQTPQPDQKNYVSKLRLKVNLLSNYVAKQRELRDLKLRVLELESDIAMIERNMPHDLPIKEIHQHQNLAS